METTETIQKVNELVSVLTDDQKQLLKDTINMGFWGDTDMEFRKENDEVETVSAYGYCTNDAKKAGNFKGRKISANFRAIYKKLCPNEGTGRFLTQISDWWDDGSGDMLFIRKEYAQMFEEGAKQK